MAFGIIGQFAAIRSATNWKATSWKMQNKGVPLAENYLRELSCDVAAHSHRSTDRSLLNIRRRQGAQQGNQCQDDECRQRLDNKTAAQPGDCIFLRKIVL